MISPLGSTLKKAPSGHAVKMGRGPVEVSKELVDWGMGEVVKQGSPKSIANVVIVVHGPGNGIVLLPNMRPFGPNVSTFPSDSVIVWKPAPKENGEPSMITSVGAVVGLGEEVVTPLGSSVKVKPSVVIVAGVVPMGKEIESVPITIPDGPRTTVCPSGSVNVSKELGRGIVDPPMTIPPGTDVCDTGVVDGVLKMAELTVAELAGSNVKVTPSVVIASGAVPDGNPSVSVPITIPLGPRMTVCPLGSVKVVEIEGKVYVEPPITTSGGVELTRELEGGLV